MKRASGVLFLVAFCGLRVRGVLPNQFARKVQYARVTPVEAVPTFNTIFQAEKACLGRERFKEPMMFQLRGVCEEITCKVTVDEDYGKTAKSFSRKCPAVIKPCPTTLSTNELKKILYPECCPRECAKK